MGGLESELETDATGALRGICAEGVAAADDEADDTAIEECGPETDTEEEMAVVTEGTVTGTVDVDDDFGLTGLFPSLSRSACFSANLFMSSAL